MGVCRLILSSPVKDVRLLAAVQRGRAYDSSQEHSPPPRVTRDARFCTCRTVATGFVLENDKAMPCQEYESAISLVKKSKLAWPAIRDRNRWLPFPTCTAHVRSMVGALQV